MAVASEIYVYMDFCMNVCVCACLCMGLFTCVQSLISLIAYCQISADSEDLVPKTVQAVRTALKIIHELELKNK